jgi:hemerythrin superfamily protein
MHPVKLIKQDHRTVKGLFRKFEASTRQSERQKIAQEIIEELSIHAAIEEQLLYPALRARDKRMESAALNALEEHHAAKLLLLELDKMKVDDERYAAKMHVLRQSVTAHIEEEEAKLLPRLQGLLDQEELEAMADAIVMMKKVAPTHPHPAAPDSGPASLVAAMVAKVSDAGKDVIRRLTSNGKAEGHKRVQRRATAAAAAAAAVAAKRTRRAGGRSRGAAAH